MESLGDKLVHLSLEIEDRTKSAHLLSQIISEQSSRHESEIRNFENEQTATFQKLSSERSNIRLGISNTIQTLLERKKIVDSHHDELLSKHLQAEKSKKENLDAIRREIADAKQAAHKTFQQEKSQREKAWFHARVSEIDKITWKGIEPNISRLVKKHQEKCEEIKADLRYAKQKLELQCENDLTERVQDYQRNELPLNALVNQRNEFFDMLAREQIEHATMLEKLKDTLVQEEVSAKNMYSLQLETLAKDYSVALSKIKCSPGLRRLAQDLSATRSARQQELESNLAHIGKDGIFAKTQWEVSWMKESAARIEKTISKITEDVLKWRSCEIDSLIRQSLLDEETSELSSDDDVQLTSSNDDNAASLKESIRKQQTVNKATEERVNALVNSKANILARIGRVEEDLSLVNGKLHDVTCEIEREKLRQTRIMQQLQDATEQYSSELRDHNKTKENIMHEHEAKLGDLETRATKSSDDIREKLQRVQNSIKKQNAILVRSQALASRYTDI